MKPQAIVCAVIGHSWHVDEASEATEPVLCCGRCGRVRLVPNTTGFKGRIAAETKQDRWVGPIGRR